MADPVRSSDRDFSSSLGHPNPNVPLDASSLEQRSSDSHSRSGRHSSHSRETEDLPHYSATSQWATTTAEQIKDIISKLASEAVEKRAEELVASRNRR